MSIYELEEFASYVQSDVDTATGLLLRDLATGLIEAITGADYDSDVPSATVKATALEAAARRYRNPEGLQSLTEAIDDFTGTKRWDPARLGVYLTDLERTDLAAEAGLVTGAFTIGPSYRDATGPLYEGTWART